MMVFLWSNKIIYAESKDITSRQRRASTIGVPDFGGGLIIVLLVEAFLLKGSIIVVISRA